MPGRRHHWNITRRLVDDAIKQHRLLINVENGVVREMATIFREVETELAGKVVKYLGDVDPDTWLTGARRARILRDLQSTINDAFPRLNRTVAKVLREQTTAEADVLVRRLEQATAQLPEDISVFRPSVKQLRELTTNALPKNVGAGVQPVAERMADLEPAAQARLKRAFQEGVVRGDGAARIASGVRKAVGAKSITARQATVWARTQIQRVANDSARMVYQQNAHLVPRVQWMATLDKRTCLLCGSKDGKLFPVNEAPVLPAHPQCRCFLAPVVASWRQMGIPGDRATPEIRRLFDGQPAPRQHYQTWLREQPATTQRQVLGRTRYDAYKQDGAALDDFSTDRRVLTVAEYKERAA